MNEIGSMARLGPSAKLCPPEQPGLVTIAYLIPANRLRTERSVDRLAYQPVQTEFGEFPIVRLMRSGTTAAAVQPWRWCAGRLGWP